MYLIFEEKAQFKTAKILSETEANLQIELASGKRSKLKKNHVIFYFENEAIETLIDRAQKEAEQLDAELLWELAPDGEFTLEAFAKEYYGDTVTTLNQTALLICLHNHPVYFHRKGKGKYQAAPQDILEKALAALEKKRQEEEQQTQWVNDLKNYHLPVAFADIIKSFLTHPDKNTLMWKAFEQALQETQLSAEQLVYKLGVYPNELALHWDSFLSTHFPKGSENPDLPIPSIPELPLASVEAYSIDNQDTTEIDDALAVTALDHSTYQISIHIAVPALVVQRDSELDLAARRRMSTLYVPGTKITMQSDAITQHFSLDAGQRRPCLSLYTKVNLETGEILAQESKLESIIVKENLRFEALEEHITHETLENEQDAIPYASFFLPLWQFAKQLSQQRDEVRGHPENNSRLDFFFKIDGAADDPNCQVELKTRRRDYPLDLMVAEYMLLANATWSKQLNEWGLPGIFRTQQGARVRQTTYAQPHLKIGVSHYGWCTSPIRRYVDLLNQQQILCGLEHGVTARLVAPYKPKDHQLYEIMSQFEATQTQWRNFQDKIERFWCLRWLQQQDIEQAQATVVFNNRIRFNDFPLTLELNDLPEAERGSQILVQLKQADLLNLTIETSYLKQLEMEPIANEDPSPEIENQEEHPTASSE